MVLNKGITFVTATVLLLVLILSINCQTPGCPTDYSVSSDGRYCWKYDSTPRTREAANDACLTAPGATSFDPQMKGLADIHSAEANDELANFIRNRVILAETEVWLGGTDLSTSYPLWQWDAMSSCATCNDAVHGIMGGQGCYNFSDSTADRRLAPLDRIVDFVVQRDEEIPERCINECRQITGTFGAYTIAALRREEPSESLRYKDFYETSYPNRDPLSIPLENRSPDGRNMRGTLCMCGYVDQGYAQYGVANSGHASSLYDCNQPCGDSTREHCGGLEANYIYRIDSLTSDVNWADGQPNADRNYQNCAASKGTKNYMLGDENCFKSNDGTAAVCRVDPTRCSPAAQSLRIGTPEAYSYFLVLDDCAHVLPDVHLNWYEARHLCREEGGDLLPLETNQKFTAYQSGMAQYVSYDRANREYLDFWVAGNAGIWMWRGIANNPLTYTNWQPFANPGDYDFGRNCMVMLVSQSNTNNYWQARECNEVKGSLCQIDRGVQTSAPSTASPSTTVPPTTLSTVTTSSPNATETSPTTASPISTESTSSATSTESILTTRTTATNKLTTTPKAEDDTTVVVNPPGNNTPDAGASTGGGDDSGLSTIEIILIVLLILLVLGIIIILLIWFCCFRKDKNKNGKVHAYDARGDASYPEDKIYIAASDNGSQRWSTDC